MTTDYNFDDARRVELSRVRANPELERDASRYLWTYEKGRKAPSGRATYCNEDGEPVAEAIGARRARLLDDYTFGNRAGGTTTLKGGTVLDELDVVALSRGMTDRQYVDEQRETAAAEVRLRTTANLDSREAWQAARDEAELLDAFDGRSPAELWSPPGDYAERIRAVFSGDYEPTKPSLLARVDGACMLYPGCTHAIFGEPGSGKSWLAIVAAAQQIKAGHPVLYLDYEDETEPSLYRLALLGCTAREVERSFVHVTPDTHPAAPKPGDTGIRAQLRRAFVDAVAAGHRGEPFSLVVVDGVTNAMAIAGYNPNANDEATLWDREVPRTIAEKSGAAVVVIDHTAKASTGGRYAIGAQSKLANVTGAAYRVDVVEDNDSTTSVHLAVYETKDRKHGVTVSTEHTEAGRLFGHFLLQTDPTRQGGLDAAVIAPAGVKDREAQAKARARELQLAESGAPLDVALKTAGGTVKLPTLLAVVVAYYGGATGMTRQQIDKAVQTYAPAVWERLDGRTAEKLRSCRYLTQRGEKYRLVEGAVDLLDERARRVLDTLRAGTDDVGVDAPAGPFGAIGSGT